MSDTETQLDILDEGPLPDEVAVEAETPATEEKPEEPVKAEAGEEESEADDEDAEAEDEAEEESEAEPEKPKRRRNRTARLAAKLTNAERQIEELRQQVQHPPQPQPVEEAPPKVEDFAKYEEYLTAHAGHVGRQAAREEMKGLNQRVAQATQEVQQQAVEAEWNKRQAKAVEKYPDYNEVVPENDDVMISTNMANAIKQMGNGTDVAYHLGKHPEESARIFQMDAMAQAVELGRISAEVRRPKPKTTSAPPPVKTVKSGLTNEKATPATASSYEEFVKLRMKEQG